MLHNLLRHGPHYLSSAELKERVDQVVAEYYRFLGKMLVLRRDQQFWGYHKTKLTDAGLGFSRFRLWKAVLANIGRAAMSPNKALSKLLTRRSQKNNVSSQAGQIEEMR